MEILVIMVRFNKKEKADKRILLTSLQQMDTEKYEDSVNGKFQQQSAQQTMHVTYIPE